MVARHKLFKNMNLDAQLEDDDVLSDGGEEYVSPEHQARLNDGLDRVREVIGGPDHSGLSDTDIKDVLWDYHFDIEETIQWAFEEIEKNNQAQERKAQSHNMKELPPLPPPEQRELGYGEYSPPVVIPRRVLEEDPAEEEERSRVPLIVQAQQQYDSVELEAEATGAPVKRNLSTITERTERTEIFSPHWPTGQQLMSLNLPRPPSSATTSYGRVVAFISIRSYTDAEEIHVDSVVNALDPDLIPVSPSGSAVHRLSFYEPAPSLPPSESDSYSSSPSPRAPSEPVPPLDTIPDIPDLNSKSSHHLASKLVTQPTKKSKLAMLASSRASTSSTRSESSRSTGTDVLGSVKTYPDLRPTSQSLASPTSVAPTSSPTSISSHVRRAIQTALELEAGDRDPMEQANTTDGSRTPTPTLNRPSAPTPSKAAVMPSSSSSPPATRPPSKLALLAQANKAARTVKPKTSGPPRLPEEHTEYLIPIANGSTVTTAITTSYQSLYSLTDPAPPRKSTSPFVVPLPTPTYVATPADAKKSKLAMKIKKAQEKHQPQPVVPEAPPPSIPPMFLPKPTRTRASPSAFASLLVDDALADAEARHLGKHKRAKEKSEPRHKSKRNPPTAVPDLFPPTGSAFDGPSPDDIVLNARRDTSLAQTRKAPPVTKPLISKT
ncbi:hypothetical protein DFH07DRAFT_912701 [Mycena maculata]|uniref:HBS1-like protein N-terminal domain-containing protein n=1 Tax=Mycena maculata TaxID=230809 RepID=A0AAD7K262_9AGAR|nr:hypothetical protein DFH07DRAFT_912701 [Mycena maculata]